MDKFFKMFSYGKKEENKAKQEEDLIVNNQKIDFEIKPLEKDKILESLVQEIKIGGKNVDNYENYIKNLDNLFSQYKPEKTELEYRYKKSLEKNSMQDIGNIVLKISYQEYR